ALDTASRRSPSIRPCELRLCPRMHRVSLEVVPLNIPFLPNTQAVKAPQLSRPTLCEQLRARPDINTRRTLLRQQLPKCRCRLSVLILSRDLRGENRTPRVVLSDLRVHLRDSRLIVRGLHCRDPRVHSPCRATDCAEDLKRACDRCEKSHSEALFITCRPPLSRTVRKPLNSANRLARLTSSRTRP